MKFNDLFFDLWININHELAPFVCYLNDILQKTLAHYNFIISPHSSQLEQIISNLGIHNTSHHISHPVRVAPGGTFQIRVY